jgi:hypothetical protein
MLCPEDHSKQEFRRRTEWLRNGENGLSLKDGRIGMYQYTIWRCPAENREWAEDHRENKWVRVDYPEDEHDSVRQT